MTYLRTHAEQLPTGPRTDNVSPDKDEDRLCLGHDHPPRACVPSSVDAWIRAVGIYAALSFPVKRTPAWADVHCFFPSCCTPSTFSEWVRSMWDWWPRVLQTNVSPCNFKNIPRKLKCLLNVGVREELHYCQKLLPTSCVLKLHQLDAWSPFVAYIDISFNCIDQHRHTQLERTF